MTGYIQDSTFLFMPPPRKRNKLLRHEMQFSPDMLAWLRLEALRRDTSVAHVVRLAVLAFMDSKP